MSSKNNIPEVAKNGSLITIVAAAYIIIGATIYQMIEGLSVVDSYYYVVVTLSTIGYGDIAPKTETGKIFTIFFIIFGIAIFSSLITNIVSRSQKRREQKLANKKNSSK